MEPEPFEEFLGRLTSVRRYQKLDREAPHKPLVLLYALSAVAAGRREIRYSETREALAPIVLRFWNSTSARIEQPFVRLSTEGFWKLSVPADELMTPSGAISVAKLRDRDVSASFDHATFDMLRARPLRVTWASRIVLFEIESSETQDALIEAFRLPL